MAIGGVITNAGLNMILSRIYGATYTVPSRFSVGTNDTTPAATDTDLGTSVLIDADRWKNFQAGYPVFDTTNKKVETRGYLDSTEANGNSIKETGEFNTDGSPTMLSRDVFTAISKTASEEIIIIWTHIAEGV